VEYEALVTQPITGNTDAMEKIRTIPRASTS
jgi:hypothetical protein